MELLYITLTQLDNYKSSIGAMYFKAIQLPK